MSDLPPSKEQASLAHRLQVAFHDKHFDPDDFEKLTDEVLILERRLAHETEGNLCGAPVLTCNLPKGHASSHLVVPSKSGTGVSEKASEPDCPHGYWKAHCGICQQEKAGTER